MLKTGPWKWYWKTTEGEADCGVLWEQCPGMAYSICRAPRYIKERDWNDVAPLIAAAPELLEALKLACEVLRAKGESGIASNCENAIAKAEGRENE